jgi:hypothetical protein
MREAARYMEGAEAAMAGHEGSPGEAVGAATEFTLREAASNPLLKAVLTDDSDGPAAVPHHPSEALLAAARERCVAYLSEHWPQLPHELVLSSPTPSTG